LEAGVWRDATIQYHQRWFREPVFLLAVDLQD
jgi:hypothetical protein